MILSIKSENFKGILLFCLILISFVSFSQTNVITLEKIKSQRQVHIKENKRIKVVTKDGTKYVGKFSVVDERTIKIRETLIDLDSIATIQKKSIFYTIIRPLLITEGSALVFIGVVGAAAGGYGFGIALAFLPIGTPMVLLPLLESKHKYNEWSYKIEKME